MSLSMRPNKLFDVVPLYQKEGDNMQEKLKELQENSLIELSNWWGLRNAGKKGIIITQDKMMYEYTFYFHLTPFLEKNNIPQETLFKVKELSEEEFKKINDFIKKEIINQTFKSESIFDVGYDVRGHYNNQSFSVNNNKGFDNEEGLYDKTEKLLKSIKGAK